MTAGRAPATPFELHEWRGSAEAFHARPIGDDARRSVWSFDVDAPAIVLGTRQSEADLDVDACRAAGVDIVHRRSGGGAVLLRPAEVVWIDVVVPSGDPLFEADVTRSMIWMGRRWVAALDALGIGDADVHCGAMERTAIGERLCFAGLGPGEVSIGGAKLVGISQRRTRHAARFQCAVHTLWDAAASVSLLATPHPAPADVPPVAVLPADVAAGLAPALAAVLGGGR